MHIIFGKEQAQELSKRYIILELDTFQIEKLGPPITAYCAIETVPFDELPVLPETQFQHEHLIINYRLRNWQDCLKGIDQLIGKWRGELDSFYSDLGDRVRFYITNPPTADWTPVILKPAR